MLVIHKFKLELTDRQVITFKSLYEPLSVIEQHGEIMLYCKVSTFQSSVATHDLVVYVVGTGHQLPVGDVKFIGTVKVGPYVWHVYVDMP